MVKAGIEIKDGQAFLVAGPYTNPVTGGRSAAITKRPLSALELVRLAGDCLGAIAEVI
ncbi:MAG: hypothetical protein ACREHG_03960 [Candidatus Saccharimonadales bacterium]